MYSEATLEFSVYQVLAIVITCEPYPVAEQVMQLIPSHGTIPNFAVLLGL